MDDNIHQFPDRQRATSASTSRRNLPAKPDPVEVVGLLTTCLALVRPVGMSDTNAADWLRVAAGELLGIDADLLRTACADARRTCTHHAQVVPNIIKATAEPMAARNRIRAMEDAMAHEREARALPKPDQWRPTKAELEELKRGFVPNLTANR